MLGRGRKKKSSNTGAFRHIQRKEGAGTDSLCFLCKRDRAGARSIWEGGGKTASLDRLVGGTENLAFSFGERGFLVRGILGIGFMGGVECDNLGGLNKCKGNQIFRETDKQQGN